MPMVQWCRASLLQEPDPSSAGPEQWLSQKISHCISIKSQVADQLHLCAVLPRNQPSPFLLQLVQVLKVLKVPLLFDQLRRLLINFTRMKLTIRAVLKPAKLILSQSCLSWTLLGRSVLPFIDILLKFSSILKLFLLLQKNFVSNPKIKPLITAFETMSKQTLELYADLRNAVQVWRSSFLFF